MTTRCLHSDGAVRRDELSAADLPTDRGRALRAGISVEPSLSRRLVSGRDRPQRRFAAPASFADDAGESTCSRTPSSASPAEAVASQAAALPAGVLGAGVLVPGLIATASGFAAWWGFGLLFLALTGASMVERRTAPVRARPRVPLPVPVVPARGVHGRPRAHAPCSRAAERRRGRAGLGQARVRRPRARCSRARRAGRSGGRPRRSKSRRRLLAAAQDKHRDPAATPMSVAVLTTQASGSRRARARARVRPGARRLQPRRLRRRGCGAP